MKMGTRLVVGGGIGVVAAVAVGAGAFLFAPPIQFPGQWAWLNNWGRIGVALGVGWATFVLTLVLTVFSIVASGFNDMERDL